MDLFSNSFQELAELCVGVLLAISLTSSEFVMNKLLNTDQSLQSFTQKLLLLVNREDDPTKVNTFTAAKINNSLEKALFNCVSIK